MAGDISPELYEAISRDFRTSLAADPLIRALNKQMESGAATYSDANKIAARAGELLSKALKRRLTASTLPDGKLSYPTAKRAVQPSLETLHELVDEVCEQVQINLNEIAGIGLAAQTVPLKGENEERIGRMVSAASDSETLEEVHARLTEPVVNYAQHVVDEAVQRNAEFQSKVGLSPKIVRTGSANCCSWCAALIGTYDYADVKNGGDVFRRHQFCRCVVTFVAGKTRQNVWNKKTWQASPDELEERKTFGLPDERDAKKLETRKQLGLDKGKSAGQREIEFALKTGKEDKTSDTICNAINRYHTALAYYTPETMKRTLEEIGYPTLPLGKGNFKGIDFEKGGGYRINFGGDGIFQYHPQARSHHGGAYWKVKNGKGERRYDMDGNEI